MGGSEEQKLPQGTPMGYRLTVEKPGGVRCSAEAKAETMSPLLELNEQLRKLGYEFIRLERVFGG